MTLADESITSTSSQNCARSDESSSASIPQRIWDIKERILPQPGCIEEFDPFDPWPDGDCWKIYRATSTSNSASGTRTYVGEGAAAARHWTGWAMRNTNNHNRLVLKKSCLGLLVCSNPKCRGDVRIRPAICDKARSRQIGKRCPTAGCTGKLKHRRCQGNQKYPVTHFWRKEGTTIYFQAKGQHDHQRPVLNWAEKIATTAAIINADTSSERIRKRGQYGKQPWYDVIADDEQAAQRKRFKRDLDVRNCESSAFANGSTDDCRRNFYKCEREDDCESWKSDESTDIRDYCQSAIVLDAAGSQTLTSLEDRWPSWNQISWSQDQNMTETGFKTITTINNATWHDCQGYSGIQSCLQPNAFAQQLSPVELVDCVMDYADYGMFTTTMSTTTDAAVGPLPIPLQDVNSTSCYVTSYPSPPLPCYPADNSASAVFDVNAELISLSAYLSPPAPCEDEVEDIKQNRHQSFLSLDTFSTISACNEHSFLSYEDDIDLGLAIMARHAGELSASAVNF